MEKGREPSNIRFMNLSPSPTTEDSSCLAGQHDFPDKGMDASFQQSVPMLLSTCASKMLQSIPPKWALRSPGSFLPAGTSENDPK